MSFSCEINHVMSVIGLVLSSISATTLTRSDKPIFIYLRAHLLNNILTCLIQILDSQSASDYITGRNLSRYYSGRFLRHANTVCYLYRSLVVIIILIDRLAYSIRRIKTSGPPIWHAKLCISLFVICYLSESFYHFILSRLDVKPSLHGDGLAYTTSWHIRLFISYLMCDTILITVEFSLILLYFYSLKRPEARNHLLSRKIIKSVSYSSHKRINDTAILMCLLSILNHVIMFICIIYPSIYFNISLNMTEFVSPLFLPFVSILDSIIVISFNLNLLRSFEARLKL